MDSAQKNAIRAKRERARQETITKAFLKLQLAVPTIQKKQKKRVARRIVLENAIAYIKKLEEELKQTNENNLLENQNEIKQEIEELYQIETVYLPNLEHVDKYFLEL
jgi:hypothetical protein